MPAPLITCRQATLEEIHPLRVAILRPGQAALHFPNDEAQPPTTWHFGAFLESPATERNIACVTYLASTHEGQPALQLRGMAVDGEFQNQGIGGKLIDFAQPIVTANTKTLWCNARVRAVRFYAAHGWQIASDEFDVPGVGPHRIMCKRLA